VTALTSTYTYRVLKSSWGILISLEAEVRMDEKGGAHAVPLGDGIILLDATPGDGLAEPAMEMLARGLRPLTAEIRSKLLNGPATIAIQGIRYNDCDFQEEGLTVAMIGWATSEFGLSQKEIPVAFDRDENRYIFDFSAIGVI
jgi:hypothetical protein